MRVECGAGEQSAVSPAGSADLVVEGPEQVIGDGLDVEFAEAGEDGLAYFGDAIVIGVLEPPEVGCGGDEDTVFPDDDACGPGEIAGEDGTAIEGAIIVVIEEQSNFSDGQIGGAFAVGLIGGLVGVGVVVHFDDEQAAIFIEGSGDGVCDEGFGGDELEGEVLLQPEGWPGLVWRQWLGGAEFGWLGAGGEQDSGEEGEHVGFQFSVFRFQFSVFSFQFSVFRGQGAGFGGSCPLTPDPSPPFRARGAVALLSAPDVRQFTLCSRPVTLCSRQADRLTG